MRKTLIALICLVALAGTACGGDDDPTIPTSPTGAIETTDPAETTDPPETTEPAEDCEDQTADDVATITMVDSAFDPTCVIVSLEKGLSLPNDGDAAHTFTIPDSEIDFEVAPHQEWNVDGPAPIEPGTYVFYCRFHGTAAGGGMAGEITFA